MPEPTEKLVETQAETTPTTPTIETIEGEPFDAARAIKLIDKLRAEIKELKPKAKQADELTQAEQKRKEAEMTELQKLQVELEKAQGELKKSQLAELKRQAAITAELPLAFADRLRGETLDELVTDAKSLLEALPKGAPKPPKVDPTNPGSGASQGETEAQQLARIHGLGVNVFDQNFAKVHGGGVVFNAKPLTKE
jgi:hypothetical protein